MKSLYTLLLSAILVYSCQLAYAQNRVVQGTIRDAQGPVPGITILEKGLPANGVSTTPAGKFKITLKGTSNVLLIRGVGYVSQEVDVSKTTTVDVILAEDRKNLDDVVIVGYGAQKKKEVTGSVASVNRAEIQQTPSASLQNALTGKLTGFYSQQRSGRPGDDAAAFFVRGVSTFNGTNVSPLILVDDVEFSYADFANIDPNEVESLSILKDAATTAIYGVKGANGVILVTTRRGKAGAPKINFRTEYGLQVPTHIPHFLDAATTATLRNESIKNQAVAAGVPYVPEFTDQDIELYRNGTDPYGHPNVDWYNTLFNRTAPSSKTNLDLSGGSESIRYFVTLGYQSQGGLLKEFHVDDNVNNNFTFNRYNFRSNLDIRPNKSLLFKLDFSGNNTVTNSPILNGVSGSGPTAAFAEVYNYEQLSPYMYSIYNPDGTYGYTNPNRTQPQGLTNNIIGRAALGGYNRERQNLMTLNVTAQQDLNRLVRGLQAKVTVSISNSGASTRTVNRVNFPSYYYDPVTNTYTPRNAQIYRIDPYSLSYAAGTPSRQSVMQGSLSYARGFGKKNNVSALLLFKQNTNMGGDYIPENFRGITGKLNYNYASRYLLELGGSYNGTDKFAARKRYGFFPAGSVGWVLSEEPFVKNNIHFVNLLKFRGSYGIVGSDNIGGFLNAYEENFARGGSYSFGETHSAVSTIVPGTLGNDNVSWEKERKMNVGMDIELFNHKLTGTVDVFANRRYDILAQRQTIATYFGVPDATLPPENLGIVSNKGYEFELGYRTQLSQNFGINLKANYSFAKNKIIEQDEVPQLYPWKTQTGRSIGEVSEWIWDGFYSAAEAADPSVPKYTGSTTAAGGPGTTIPGFLKYRDVNGDGVVNSDDQGYFGKPNLPNTNIGFNMGFTYHKLSLNVLLQSALNYDVQIGYTQVTPWKGNLRDFHLKRWTPETAETAEFPTLVADFQGTYMSAGGNSSFWAVSGDYLRIKSVELGYMLPAKWAGKVGLESARLYVNGYNLHTWSQTFERFGLDPESARGGSGGYTVPYPQSAMFNVGCSLSLK